MPRADMDHGFLERIKGFAIDFFVLVQEQRKVLAANVNEMEIFKRFVKDIDRIASVGFEPINFKVEFKKLGMVQERIADAIEVMEQFKILMKCSPEDVETQHKAVISTNNTFSQKSHLYSKIVALSEEVLSEFKQLLQIATKSVSRFNTSVTDQVQQFSSVTDKVGELKEYFVMDNEFSVYGKPICDLHRTMTETKLQINAVEEKEETLLIDGELDNLAHSMLIAIQSIYKKFEVPVQAEENEEVLNLVPNHLKEKMHKELALDILALNLKSINLKLESILNSTFVSTNSRLNNQLLRVSPLLKQFELLNSYFFIQQLSAHKLSTKMLSIMLSTFLELATKGFCVPQDLLSDEEQKEENDTKTGDGFGFEDGDGEKDVSDKLESEDQLDEARKPEDYEKKSEEPEKDCKEEEKGIDMSDDFDGKMQDVDKVRVYIEM
jgi:midasin